tara:strand:+ start:39582 stop:39749 length:168 start_codon:yes stop_codon:yes gene_type:complete
VLLKNAGHQSNHRVQNNHRGDLTTIEDVVADGQFFGSDVFGEALLESSQSSANQN